MPQRWGFHAKTVFFLEREWWWLVFSCLDYRALLDLPSNGSHNVRRCTLTGICWCIQGEVGSYLGLRAEWVVWRKGLPGGQGVGENYVCYLVIVKIFMGLGGAKKYGGGFKPLSRGQATKRGGPFLWGRVDPSRHHGNKLDVVPKCLLKVVLLENFSSFKITWTWQRSC